MEKDELLAYCVEEIIDELEQTETEENDGSDEDTAYLFGKRIGLCTAISIIKSAVAGFEEMYGLEEDFDAKYLHR